MRRKTKQKEAILRILNNTRAHPTADWIYEEVKKEIPNISKGTVYRNLKVLLESRAVSELNLNGTLSRFEVKQASHYHFRCEQCGKVMDVEVPVDKKLDQKVAISTGLKIYSHQLEFRGVCLDCQHKKIKGEVSEG
jgi:Fur family peroxide stress response transcriptional regulator